VAATDPDTLSKNPRSHTGAALRPVLERGTETAEAVQ
jgi:excinuclease ABC subunit A